MYVKRSQLYGSSKKEKKNLDQLTKTDKTHKNQANKQKAIKPKHGQESLFLLHKIFKKDQDFKRRNGRGVRK